jgi:hypothetical protein
MLSGVRLDNLSVSRSVPQEVTGMRAPCIAAGVFKLEHTDDLR